MATRKVKAVYAGKPVAPKGPVSPGTPATSTIGSPSPMNTNKCPMCTGKGKAEGGTCLMCEGSGKVR